MQTRTWAELADRCVWDLPDLRAVPGVSLDDPDLGDLICAGADLAPETLARAYSIGLFPMPDPRSRRRRSAPPTWWSPASRAVLPLDGMRVTRSLRQSARRYEVRVDTAFDEVVRGCADPSREGGWIDQDFLAAYSRLHDLGLAHSVETWSDDELVGGLYGVSLGGLFAGESMFHRARDASKVALLGLVGLLDDGQPDRLLDVQWVTPHLASLGVVEVPRSAYLTRLLPAALRLPEPRWTAPRA